MVVCGGLSFSHTVCHCQAVTDKAMLGQGLVLNTAIIYSRTNNK